MNETSSDRTQHPDESGSHAAAPAPGGQTPGESAPGESTSGETAPEAQAPSPAEPSEAATAEEGLQDEAAAAGTSIDGEAEDEEDFDEDAPLPAEFYRISGARSRSAAVDAARRELARHEVVVMPTDTVYGIAANAFSARGVQRLLEAKGRDRTMPPPVLVAHAGVLDGLADQVSEETRALAGAFWPGGLTLICHAQPSLQWDLGETRGTVALRVPDDAVAQALLQETGPLAVSSANRTGMPAATTAEQAREMLGDDVRVYLEDGPRTEGRDPSPSGQAPAPVASTIVDCTGGVPTVVRHGQISLTRLREVVPSVISRDGADPASSGPIAADPAGADSTAADSAAADTAGSVSEGSASAGPDRIGSHPAGATAAGSARDDAPDRASGAAETVEAAAPSPEDAQPARTAAAQAEGAGGSTVADPEIGIVEQARAEQDRAEGRTADFSGASATGTSAAAAVVALGARGGRGARAAAAGVPDQDRTRPAAADTQQTRPLGLAQASALVAFSAQAEDEDDLAGAPRDSGVDQQR